jgi:hypothetical protein
VTSTVRPPQRCRSPRATVLHNNCITTHGHSETLTGTQEVRAVQLKRLTSTFLPPLQGGGRRFDSYSAHEQTVLLRVLLDIPPSPDP